MAEDPADLPGIEQRGGTFGPGPPVGPEGVLQGRLTLHIRREVSKSVLEALKHNMREALAQNRARDAADVLARLKAEDPLSRETRGFELEYYIVTNRLDEAGALAGQLCRLFPDSGRIHFLAGKLAYRKKRYDEAEGSFRESLRIYPSPQTTYWLGRTLTQNGRFEEAESLLMSVREHNPRVLCDLAWLCERRNDLEGALKAYDEFLSIHPEDRYAGEQRIRLKAMRMEPEALIEEVQALEGLGEEVPAAMLGEYLRRLFESGQGPQARCVIMARKDAMDARLGVGVGWICYKAQAYDLACMLFLSHLQENLNNVKFLVALEAAAAKCSRIPQVLEAYRRHLDQAKHLYGRCRSLMRRSHSSR